MRRDGVTAPRGARRLAARAVRLTAAHAVRLTGARGARRLAARAGGALVCAVTLLSPKIVSAADDRAELSDREVRGAPGAARGATATSKAPSAGAARRGEAAPRGEAHGAHAPSEAQRAGAGAVDVEVRGERGRSSSRDPSASSTVLREAELSAPGVAATDALKWAPGVEVARSGSRAERATLSLRGSSAAQVPVYLGPFRLNDELTGAADLSALPLWVLERAEVFRGASPTAAGSFGLGGGVYLAPRLPKRSQARLGVGLGSHGERWLSGAVSVASPGLRRGEAGSGALISFRRVAADNDFSYLDDAGTAFDASDDVERTRGNADHQDDELWAIGVTRFASGARLLSVVNGLTREHGVSGLGVVPSVRARSASQRFLAGVSGRAPCGDERRSSACAVEISTSFQLGRERTTDPLSEIGVGQVPAQNQSVRLTQRGQVERRVGPLTALALFEVTRDALTLTQRERAFAERLSLRPAAQGKLEVSDELTLLLAGGFVAVTTDAERGEPEESLMPEGRVGARWELAPITVRANLGHYARRATLGELYGLSALVRGNSSLTAERGEAADLGVTAHLRAGTELELTASALGFARVSRALIAYRRSTFGVVTPFNVGEGQVLGAEGSLLARYAAWLSLEVNLTVQEPRDVTEGRALANELLPYHSRLTGGARALVSLDDWLASPMQLGLSAYHRSSRFADPAGLLVIPAQTTVDLEWSSAPLSSLRLSLAARNLLGQAQFDLLGQPLPGRTYHGAVELLWE